MKRQSLSFKAIWHKRFGSKKEWKFASKCNSECQSRPTGTNTRHKL